MFKSILVPIDIAHESSWRFAVPEAVELARASGGRLTIVTIVRELSALFESAHLAFQLERMVSDARARLRTIIASIETAGVPLSQDVKFGSIGPEILRAAAEQAADLIVMESHRPEMLDYVIGPNAAHVARHAICSVLVLRKAAAPD